MGGSRIAGRYELQEELGEGGMGVVWRALDVKTGSSVAIKLMKDISDPVAVELFTKEWKALAEISHPNIVEVRDVDVIEENRQKKPFFVMPLLRGSTLADLIAHSSSRLTLDRVVDITTHVCRGLYAAHQRGLVHRDLKPSNIFVMEDDTAKIIDFGVVHLAGTKSITGQKGTFQYMSPEQAQLKEITPASDLFSMGVILYEALTGVRPFACKTAEETMEAVIKFMPPPVSEINPNINQSVSRVVHKCLAKLPIHRFANARELADALQRAARNEAVVDMAKIEPRIERAKTAFKNGDLEFSSEILAELEAEGYLDPRITVLRMQIDLTVKQKKIRQLLESARARMEQDEIPLALQKIREVLELDPKNSDALAMREKLEKERSESQIAKWLELAQTHLEHRDFAAARHATEEVLAIRADPRALDLLEKIESAEADAKRVRDQKEQLYGSALQAYQNGEIETALSKMERLFSVARANPNAATPERDAVYESFYEEVRSERDSIRSALEDAQRLFSEKQFAAAMTVCQGLLAKYPNDGTFQTLKIRIEDAERQELSAYIAEISKRMDAEPDLDRRVNILKEACERYPNETQFPQQLKVIRERRDLVNSIAGKARQYEERGQFSEAISQWDTLRNIHPQYPGIAFELEQCKKKRDRQAREEEHIRLVQEIDGLLEGRAYAKAIECANAALLEFPNDTELSGLRTLAEQGLERTKKSRHFFEEGQQALAARDWVRATELLRDAYSLDPRGPGLRDAVVNVLTERARALAEDNNWGEAEPLYQEASELDGTHPAVRALRSSLTEARRQNAVGQCLIECRSLVAEGKLDEARKRISAARAQYPKDPRLEQYEAGLQKEENAVRRKEAREKDRIALNEIRRVAEQNIDDDSLIAVDRKLADIRARYVDDAEMTQTVAEVELAVKRATNVEKLGTGTYGQSVPIPKPRPDPKKGPQPVDGQKTKIFPPPKPKPAPKERAFRVFVIRAEQFLKTIPNRTVTFFRPAGKWSSERVIGLSSVLVLAAVGVYLSLRPHPQPPPPPPQKLVQITVEPADSTIVSDGNPVTTGSVEIGKTIEVAHLGYRSKQVQIQQDSDGRVVLEPEAVRLSISTSGTAGSLELDGQAVELTEGALEQDLPADGQTHVLSVKAQNKPLFTLQVQLPPGEQPKVTSLDASDLLVIASLGNKATVYGGTQVRAVQFGDQTIPVSSSGGSLDVSDHNRTVMFSNGSEQNSVEVPFSNAPTLNLQSLNAIGQVVVTTNVENATLLVDDLPVPPGRHGWTVRGTPGRTYNFKLTAEGYEPIAANIDIQRGRVHKEMNFPPRPTHVPALVINGGTPGASVLLDGVKIGELDSSGNLQHTNLSLGKHTVALSKPGFEERTYDAIAGSSGDCAISKPLLTPITSYLTVLLPQMQPPVKDLRVAYRRVGDSHLTEISVGTKKLLPPGEYEIAWEAPGYKTGGVKLNLPAKQDVQYTPVLETVQDYVFQDPSQIVHDGDWQKAKAPGSFVDLRRGILHVGLVFRRPGKKLFWDKKVEWAVEDQTHQVRVQYTLEGKKLSRRFSLQKETQTQSDKTVEAQAVNQEGSFSVHVRVDGATVRIVNDKGVVMDEFTVQGKDFSGGGISVKTEDVFIARREP